MMGVEGGSSFERQLYRSRSYVHEVMMGVCTNVVDEALREEMVSTVRETLKGKIGSAKMDKMRVLPTH